VRGSIESGPTGVVPGARRLTKERVRRELQKGSDNLNNKIEGVKLISFKRKGRRITVRPPYKNVETGFSETLVSWTLVLRSRL